MSDTLLSELQLYFGTAGILFAGAVIFSVLALRASGAKRRFLLVGVIPAGAMSVAYVMMGAELLTVTVTAVEREQSIGRFFAYTAILLAVPYILKVLVELSRRQYALLACFLLLMPWLAFVSWLVEGPAEAAASAGAFLAYLCAAYLMYVPYAGQAKQIGGERQLLYIKVCHLAILCYGVLIITSGLSEQSAGILDFFIGQFVASFADLVFTLSFAALLYYTRSAFDEISGQIAPQNASSVDQPTTPRPGSGD